MAAKPNTITMMLTLTTDEFAAVEAIVSPPPLALAPVGLRMRPPSRPDVVKAGLGRLVAIERQAAEASPVAVVSAPPAASIPRQRFRAMAVPAVPIARNGTAG